MLPEVEAFDESSEAFVEVPLGMSPDRTALAGARRNRTPSEKSAIFVLLTSVAAHCLDTALAPPNSLSSTAHAHSRPQNPSESDLDFEAILDPEQAPALPNARPPIGSRTYVD